MWRRCDGWLCGLVAGAEMFGGLDRRVVCQRWREVDGSAHHVRGVFPHPPYKHKQEILAEYLTAHPTSPLAINLKACNAFK